MLKAEHRLRRSQDFTSTVRRGAAARRDSLVVHAHVPNDHGPAKVGFVVGRAVGGAVVRNTVRRRLRHLVACRVTELPDGSTVVVRALPDAGRVSRETLAADLRGALGTAVRRARSR
ncbi:ribonuclease P protein component [Phytoactinopolyspora halotolerans]|uniref:Ribonuclease P protein component n=1 Tax=Phytoactinopolyspora halotolerans TaxID=1981512 RepID=A0A6L9S1K9_9ACTN|nr:ribonuclease P protein component [Phytoactinopolyspora halotolerans]NED98700.1 ribonuclease P protein component [Phytoactinopolyspora halotolerans]